MAQSKTSVKNGNGSSSRRGTGAGNGGASAGGRSSRGNGTQNGGKRAGAASSNGSRANGASNGGKRASGTRNTTGSRDGSSRGGGTRAASGSRGNGTQGASGSHGNGTRATSGSRGNGTRSGGVRGAGEMSGQQRMSAAAARGAQGRMETPPLVRREISAILLMAVGVLLFMGLFFKDSAGFIGDVLRALSGGLFGVTGWFLPFLVFAQGAYRMFARSGHPLWNRFFNMVLLMMLISAMFQAGAHPRSTYTNESLGRLLVMFFKEGADALEPGATDALRTGGLFGGILGVPLLLLFQKAGAMVVLAALGLVVALVVTRISLVDMARSVARGTAGTFGGMAEAARRRREERLALYEAQTREWADADAAASPDGTAHREMERRQAEGGLSGSGRRGKRGAEGPYVQVGQAVANAAGVSASRTRGGRFLDVTPGEMDDMDGEEPESGPSMRYPASFVHPDRDVGDLRIGADTDPDDGNAFDGNGRDQKGYDRHGRDQSGYDQHGNDQNGRKENAYQDNAYRENGYNEDGFEADGLNGNGFDPFTGEPVRQGVWAAALRNTDDASDDPYAMDGDPEETLSSTGDTRKTPHMQESPAISEPSTGSNASVATTPNSPDVDASVGNELVGNELVGNELVGNASIGNAKAENVGEPAGSTSDPKAEWLKQGLAPVPDNHRNLRDAPPKDLAAEWEAQLAREEERRRTGGNVPVPGETGEDPEERIRPYTPPPLELMKLSREDEQNMRRIRATAEENARKLESTLESFGIGAKVNHISVGPAITRYELQPAPGIKVSRIVNLTDDIALNLAASGVRIEAPIPGKAAIGVEVPNKEVAPISLRSVLESKEFEAHPSKLAVALGKDISGENMVADLAKMPHVLIAGATGAGKSVCINSIVVSLLYKAKPEEVKLLMIDPKVVELGVYNGIPHLLIPVVTDPNKAAGALRWAVQEMVMRYKLFADRGVRDLSGYNASVEETGTGMKLPQMVIIIDELADLMMVAPHDVEDSICRLAQMARAAGMHLVIATQRPSVNVITGVIKANVPSRIAFAVSSQVDSRTIIDMAGAEKLLGKGDMLFYPVGLPKPVRVKGCFIPDKEVELVVEHVKAQALVRYDEDVLDSIEENQPAEAAEAEADEDDGLLDEAVEALIDSGQASVSFIQRRFKVGYARAGRIIDQMAEKGIISGYEGSKPRRVLITRDMWNEMRMQKDIRAAEAAKGGRVNEQLRLRTVPRENAGADMAEDSQPVRWTDAFAKGGDHREAPVVDPQNSAFLRRAMSDAEERERRHQSYGDDVPDDMDDSAGYREDDR